MVDPCETFSTRKKCKLVRNRHGSRHTAVSMIMAAMSASDAESTETEAENDTSRNSLSVVK